MTILAISPQFHPNVSDILFQNEHQIPNVFNNHIHLKNKIG